MIQIRFEGSRAAPGSQKTSPRGAFDRYDNSPRLPSQVNASRGTLCAVDMVTRWIKLEAAGPAMAPVGTGLLEVKAWPPVRKRRTLLLLRASVNVKLLPTGAVRRSGESAGSLDLETWRRVRARQASARRARVYHACPGLRTSTPSLWRRWPGQRYS